MSDKPQSSSNGQQCSVCGYRNRPGVLVCENCGTQLVALTRGTGSLQKNRPAAKPADTSSAGSTSSDPTQPRPGTASVPEKKESGTVAAVSAETVKPGMTAEELQASAKADSKTASEPVAKPLPVSAEPAAKLEPAAKVEPAARVEPAVNSEVTGVETKQEPALTRAGKICPNCAHSNRPGVLICENCGTNLETGALSPAGTHSLEGKDVQKLQSEAIEVARNLPLDDVSKTGHLGEGESSNKLDTSQMEAMRSAGSLVFEDEMVLRLEIDGAPTPILVYPKRETILGRRDPITGGAPDVDMTSYAGYRMGVSRQHAVVRLEEKRLHISDLGSSNGTFVNGVRLIPYQPHPLRDGDKIALGKMAIHVFFQSGVKRK
jgi:uncharacterized OB-fold protein